MSFAAAPLYSQDATRKPAPAEQQPAAPPAKASPSSSREATPLQKAVHQKKVITEEDLTKPVKVVPPSEAEGEEDNPACDLACESELRSEMGFTPDREIEFRSQLTLARSDIGADRDWTFKLGDALEAARRFCDLQRHKEEIVAKGNAPQYVRDSVNAQYAARERELSGQYREAEGQLTQRLQAVERFAPFRAAVMRHQWNAAAFRACPDFKLP